MSVCKNCHYDFKGFIIHVCCLNDELKIITVICEEIAGTHLKLNHGHHLVVIKIVALLLFCSDQKASLDGSVMLAKKKNIFRFISISVFLSC